MQLRKKNVIKQYWNSEQVSSTEELAKAAKAKT
jgi:hypothetical protein